MSTLIDISVGFILGAIVFGMGILSCYKLVKKTMTITSLLIQNSKDDLPITTTQEDPDLEVTD